MTTVNQNTGFTTSATSLLNSSSIDIKRLQQELQLGYSLAKKRASELSALAIDSPPKYKPKLNMSSKAHLAISTILYTALTLPLLKDLEEYVVSTSHELPNSLFNINEWKDLLNKANTLKTLVATQESGGNLKNEFQLLQNDLQSLRKDNEKQLHQMSEILEKIKSQVIHTLKSMEINIMTIENNALVKEIKFKEDIEKLEEINQKLRDSMNDHVLLQTAEYKNQYNAITSDKISSIIRTCEERVKMVEKRSYQQVSDLQDQVLSLKNENIILSKQYSEHVSTMFGDNVNNIVSNVKTSSDNLLNVISKTEENTSLLLQKYELQMHEKEVELSQVKLKSIVIQDIINEMETSIDELIPPSLIENDAMKLAPVSSDWTKDALEQKKKYLNNLLIKFKDYNDKKYQEINSHLISLEKSFELQKLDADNKYKSLEKYVEDSELESIEMAKELAFRNHEYQQLLSLYHSDVEELENSIQEAQAKVISIRDHFVEVDTEEKVEDSKVVPETDLNSLNLEDNNDDDEDDEEDDEGDDDISRFSNIVL